MAAVEEIKRVKVDLIDARFRAEEAEKKVKKADERV